MEFHYQNRFLVVLAFAALMPTIVSAQSDDHAQKVREAAAQSVKTGKVSIRL